MNANATFETLVDSRATLVRYQIWGGLNERKPEVEIVSVGSFCFIFRLKIGLMWVRCQLVIPESVCTMLAS